MATEIVLKPCPFCGGKAYIEWCKEYFGDYMYNVMYNVLCEQCNATSAKCFMPKEAAEKWNRRVR